MALTWFCPVSEIGQSFLVVLGDFAPTTAAQWAASALCHHPCAPKEAPPNKSQRWDLQELSIARGQTPLRPFSGLGSATPKPPPVSPKLLGCSWGSPPPSTQSLQAFHRGTCMETTQIQLQDKGNWRLCCDNTTFHRSLSHFSLSRFLFRLLQGCFSFSTAVFLSFAVYKWDIWGNSLLPAASHFFLAIRTKSKTFPWTEGEHQAQGSFWKMLIQKGWSYVQLCPGSRQGLFVFPFACILEYLSPVTER